MSKVEAIGDKILAEMIDKPADYKQTKSGIFIQEKDGTANAIRNRWFKIYAVGPEIDFVKEGEYVLVEHGRWSVGMKVNDDLKLYLLDNKDCLAVSDEEPDLTDL